MLKFQRVAQPQKKWLKSKIRWKLWEGTFFESCCSFFVGLRDVLRVWAQKANSDDSRFSEAVSEYWGGNDRNKLSQNCLFVKHFNLLKIWGWWPLGCLNWLIWKRYLTWVNFSHIMATVTLKNITFWQAYQGWEWHIPRMFGGKDVYKNQGWNQSVLIPWIFTRQWREHRSVVVAFRSLTVTKKPLKHHILQTSSWTKRITYLMTPAGWLAYFALQFDEFD